MRSGRCEGEEHSSRGGGAYEEWEVGVEGA